MDSVVEQLSEIEKTAEDIVEHAEKQKAEIEHQIQNERDVFDRETEQATQEELSRIRAQAKKKWMQLWRSRGRRTRSFWKNCEKNMKKIMRRMPERY